MKKLNFLTLITVLTSLILTSCGEDNNTINTDDIVKTKSKTINITTSATGSDSDPSLQKGTFTKISFKEGKVVEGDNWDIAVRGRLFLVNGSGQKDKSMVLGYDNEPKRTKDVSVITMTGDYNDVKSAEKLPKILFNKDLSYPQGVQYLSTAINFASNTRSGGQSNQAWHVRSFDNANIMLLTPVVFVFKTQDGRLTKMVIEKMKRTNKDFDTKEDIEYTFKYFYNPEETLNLDDSL